MPIASAANPAPGPGSQFSSKSSMFSNETPNSFRINTNGTFGLASNRLEGEENGIEVDEFRENNNNNSGLQFVPSSSSANPMDPNNGHHLPRQPHSSYSMADEDSIEQLSWIRQKCGEVVDDEKFQMFILLLIATNSIMIGVGTFPLIKENPGLERIFEIIDLVVLIIFTMESIIQFVFNGFRRFFRDGWLVFDLAIVVISWISVEIEELRSLRVFRALRFVTQVSLLRNVVVALFSIVPAITAIFTLLLLIFYIFAVMFTTLFKDMHAEGHTDADYFGRLDYTLFTLFQLLCLDEWSGIAYEVAEVYYWSWAIFIAFVVMSAFVVVNLLIAVICDALQILRVAEEQMLEEKLYGQEPTEQNQEIMGDEVMDQQTLSNERLRRKVIEMQQMIDAMQISQENMARTIQYLSLALYADRKPDELVSIRETGSEDAANR
mmetsp:Transcript_41374/g.86847  ORF Transcript_41374/g.86847 Transcript_41374/m.86847 type:complete len:436 (-) Transcript_41374:118-1425(-)|eukprot:CAMPEP_0183727508 /NCGR_PEP_ID=MMETSP0737-20130205/25745_1 /TAXON_ID=385413 /ORGANISM="Thalassiosira miniscula, Strain CCMP1093" /LENGTH=435 /DNA_ID=CAMNT_0025959161 /DNA_START=289 /DNA_END=1596 /DNA_ORIENTATION=+